MHKCFHISRTFPDLSLAAVAFTLTVAVEEQVSPGICPPTYTLPDTLKRFIFRKHPGLLFAVIPDLENHIRLTLMNTSYGSGMKFIQNVLSDFEKQLKLGIRFQLSSGDVMSDPDVVTICAAYETITHLWLEALGYKFLRLGRAPALCLQSFGVFNLDLKVTSVNSLLALTKASSTTLNKFRKECQLSIVGDIKFIDFKELKDDLEMSVLETFKARGKVRLDSVPCSVFPNGTIAYAVEYSKDVPDELVTYWKYIHGIDLVGISSVFNVTFVRGCEDFTLTYPSQCVFIPHTFLEKPLRRAGSRLDEFEASLDEHLKMMMNVIKLENRTCLNDI